MFGSSTPTKTVSNQAEWITAFGKAVDATVFVFPHRRRELDAYRQYILDMFTSTGEHAHERIILLDRRIRNEAAGRRDLELNDSTPNLKRKIAPGGELAAPMEEEMPRKKSRSLAGATTTSAALPAKLPADTPTSAHDANETIPSPSATVQQLFPSDFEVLEPRARRPKYLRDFIWTLPRPPLSEYTATAMKTLTENQHQSSKPTIRMLCDTRPP